jgi:RNA-directed DNA polymerase
VTDKRVLKLIRAFLKSGVTEDGLVSPVDEGTPQAGPLSPLLSNLVLDELDKELTRRGHRFCRYADDCNIYVRSRRAGERVMASVSQFLTQKLRLKVNEAKSAVARPEERKFLGFSISNDGSERRIAPKAPDKFKTQVRDMTRRTWGISLRREGRRARQLHQRVLRVHQKQGETGKAARVGHSRSHIVAYGKWAVKPARS